MSLDIEAMKALVGEASISPESARAILEDSGATVADITDPELKPLWSVLEARVRERQPIDVFGVRQSLKSQPRAAQAATDVILECVLGRTKERLDLLRDSGVRVRLIEGMRRVAAESNSGKSLNELANMIRALPEILRGGGTRVRNCKGDALKHMDRLDRIWSGKGVPRIQMGLGAIDEALGGLINNLIVLGARPGVGKSALVAGLVRNWLKAGVRVGVLCYEDDALDLQARLIACEGGTALKVSRGDMPPNKLEQGLVSDGLEWFAGVEHLLEVDDDRPSGTAADVVATIRSMVDRGARVILLDNMTCVRLDKTENRPDLVVEAALREIRDCAQSLQVPIIVAGHIKRGSDGTDESFKPPRLSDFSNAMAWENYSRVALGMWRGEGGVLLKVMKQTNGPAGDVFDVEFRRESAVVTNTTKHEQRDDGPPVSSPPKRFSAFAAKANNEKE